MRSQKVVIVIHFVSPQVEVEIDHCKFSRLLFALFKEITKSKHDCIFVQNSNIEALERRCNK